MLQGVMNVDLVDVELDGNTAQKSGGGAYILSSSIVSPSPA